ncbi:hypothetical protein A4A29_09680 [Staphylococcus equorum]|uniref:hypothetical protein n=1 Tax=Staphylococcus equorum TaxID=246432 RepID=UPI0008FAFAB2|nr:hypothetical protein [Staphylococcus equorum]OIS52052.1 hypothetical protein A4A29_09680 [Staphylococcus equorum]
MEHNIEGDIRNCIEVANYDYSLSHLDEPMLNYYNELVAKAKAFDEVKRYALSKNKDFEDRKDTAGSNKEFNYFNTLQIANRAIINKCKQLEDE